MTGRRFLFLNALLPLLASLAVDAASLFKGKAKYQDDEVKKLVLYQDGVLADSGQIYFTRFDSEAAHPFVPAGMDLLLEVDSSSGDVVFLGAKDKKYLLMRESSDGKLRSIDLPEEIQLLAVPETSEVSRPHLIPSTHDVALIAGGSLWWREEEKWTSRPLPPVPKFYLEFDPESFGPLHFFLGDTRFFLDDTLYAGWNRGEWGGMLASIDLKEAHPEWKHLSGKKPGDPSGIPANEPVQSLLSPDGRSLWVATGLAHLSGYATALYRHDPDGTWKTLIEEDSDDYAPKIPPKLPRESVISALATDSEKRVHLLVSGAGVFQMGSSLLPVMEDDFSNYNNNTESVVDKNTTEISLVSCYPNDLVIAKDGALYISTNSFGILAFRKDGDQWKGHQILIKKP